MRAACPAREYSEERESLDGCLVEASYTGCRLHSHMFLYTLRIVNLYQYRGEGDGLIPVAEYFFIIERTDPSLQYSL
jgi:hypothetical protein